MPITDSEDLELRPECVTLGKSLPLLGPRSSICKLRVAPSPLQLRAGLSIPQAGCLLAALRQDPGWAWGGGAPMSNLKGKGGAQEAGGDRGAAPGGRRTHGRAPRPSAARRAPGAKRLRKEPGGGSGAGRIPPERGRPAPGDQDPARPPARAWWRWRWRRRRRRRRRQARSPAEWSGAGAEPGAHGLPHVPRGERLQSGRRANTRGPVGAAAGAAPEMG